MEDASLFFFSCTLLRVLCTRCSRDRVQTHRRIRYGNLRGAALHTQDISLVLSFPYRLAKTFAPVSEGPADGAHQFNHRLPADCDFRATPRRLLVEAENWLCLFSCSSRRLKWKLPGLLLSDAPWVSQQKAKDRGCNLHLQRKKKNSFARSCSHHTPANIFGICHGRVIQVLQTASALIHSSTPPLAHAPFVPARLLPPRSSLPEGHHPLQAPLDTQGCLSSSCTAPNRSFLKEFMCSYKPGCINAGMVCATHVPASELRLYRVPDNNVGAMAQTPGQELQLPKCKPPSLQEHDLGLRADRQEDSSALLQILHSQKS